MPKDYKKRTSKRDTAASPWQFLLGGFALGLVAAFLVYQYIAPNSSDTPKPDRVTTPQSIAETEKHVSQNKVTAPQTAEPLPEPGQEDYQFYTMLPDFEVVVSDDNPPESTAPTRVVPTPRNNEPVAYILQAGSFKNFTDADRRKAELAFKGLESNIQQVVLDQNQIWYRVYVGPSDNMAKLEDIRSLLRRDDIDAFFIRVK